jgi:hypothetical protein
MWMARRTASGWMVWVVAGVLGAGAVLWLRTPEPEPEPTDDHEMTKDEERALMQEIGYLK